jgi:hypothetical protein
VRAASEPLSRRLRIPDTWAVAIVFALFLTVVVLGGYLFGKQIAAQTTELWSALKEAAGKLQGRLNESPIGSWLLEIFEGGSDPEAMAKAFKGTVTVFGGSPTWCWCSSSRSTSRSIRRPIATASSCSCPPRCAIAWAARWTPREMPADVVARPVRGHGRSRHPHRIGLSIVGVPLAIPLGILAGILDFVPFIGPPRGGDPGDHAGLLAGSRGRALRGTGVLRNPVRRGHFIMPLAQKWAVQLPPVLGLLAIVGLRDRVRLHGRAVRGSLTVVTYVMVKRLWVEKREGAT